MRVIWTAQAETELKAALSYAQLRWPGAVAKIAADVLGMVERLRSFPLSGRSGVVAGTRELVLTRYPFIVVYMAGVDAVTVLRIYHQRMKWPPETA